MLVLECVKKKKIVHGTKWGGLLPISSLGSQHCSGVATGGPAACTTGAPMHTIEYLGAGMPRKACRDRPP